MKKPSYHSLSPRNSRRLEAEKRNAVGMKTITMLVSGLPRTTSASSHERLLNFDTSDCTVAHRQVLHRVLFLFLLLLLPRLGFRHAVFVSHRIASSQCELHIALLFGLGFFLSSFFPALLSFRFFFPFSMFLLPSIFFLLLSFFFPCVFFSCW